MAKLEDKLTALATMSPARLRGEWLQTFGCEAPDVGSRMLALGIAHRLQEKVHGGLSPAHRRELDRLARHFAATGEVKGGGASKPSAGSRLVRDWHGKTHHVLIREKDFVYEDRSYRSLSHIAREITGTAWSGPRFFGLIKGVESARG
ncbi:MAG: DUF2924 domain-containing protein [Sphingomonadaceae bacterium]